MPGRAIKIKARQYEGCGCQTVDAARGGHDRQTAARQQGGIRFVRKGNNRALLQHVSSSPCLRISADQQWQATKATPANPETLLFSTHLCTHDGVPAVN